MENILFLYIDLFCGAGGTSSGVEKARINGKKIAKVIACINHDRNAIASHKANHPEAVHYTEDIRTLDLTGLIAHIAAMRLLHPKVKIVLWASLECTNFSRAKGGMSRDADSRTLAEHLYRYILALNPDYIQIENVTEFMDWGPLVVKVKHDKKLGTSYCPLHKTTEGKGRGKIIRFGPTWVPEPARKGEYYRRWLEEVKSYGYHFDHRVLNAADFGARTSRKRYFGVFAKQGLEIIFPQQTHAKNPEKHPGKNYEKWLPVRDVLDLQDDGESIFDRNKAVVENSLKRINEGLKVHISGGDDSYLIKYNSVNQKTGKHVPPGLNDPCPVVAAQNRLGIAKVHYLVKAFSGAPEHKNMPVSEPCGAITTVDHHQFITAYYGNGFSRSLDEPSPGITTKDRISLISTDTFIDQQFGKSLPASIDSTLGCITANPKYRMIKCRHWILNPQYSSKGGSMDSPCFTLIARMDKAPPRLMSVVQSNDRLPSFIKREGQYLIYEIYPEDSGTMVEIKEFMAAHGLVDIRMRMLNEAELLRIMGFGDRYVLKGNSTERKKYIGNAVHVLMAQRLCEAQAAKHFNELKIAA